MHSSASFDSSPTSIATLDNLPAGQPKRSPMITPRMVTGQSPRDSHQLPHLPHVSPSESSASAFSTDLNWSQALPSHISMPHRAQPNLQAGFLLDSVFRTAITLMLDAHPQKMIRNFGMSLFYSLYILYLYIRFPDIRFLLFNMHTGIPVEM
jgi:hypothetical protein